MGDRPQHRNRTTCYYPDHYTLKHATLLLMFRVDCDFHRAQSNFQLGHVLSCLFHLNFS